VTRPTDRTGILLFAAGTAIVSFSAPIVRLVTTPPTITAFYRMLFGGVILTIIVLMQGGRLSRDRRSLLLAAICGLAFACDLSLWHRSIRIVGPGLATILVSMQVFFMAGFGLLFNKERPTWRILVGIPLAIFGLLMIVGVDWRLGGPSYRLGIAFGLTTALCYTTFLLFLRRLQRNANGPTRMANIATLSLFSAVFLGIFSLAARESFTLPGLPTAGLLVVYGIIGQVVAWVLMSRALPYLRASTVGLMLLIQPTLSAIWDVLFFHRATTPLEVLGAALTLGAIYLGSVGTASVSESEPTAPAAD
jgi:drug/metabolite transporter (DMT)-like permease